MTWTTRDASDYLAALDGNRAIDLLRSIPYMDSHRALVALAATIKDDDRNDGLHALACATYGWMPTILGPFEPENFRRDTPVAAIRDLGGTEAAREFIEAMDERAPINGSWVGTSKLLHFLRPDLFPIWDSRVAERFGLKWPHQVNKKATYLHYFDFVQEELERGYPWVAEVVQAIEAGHGYIPTDVRCLELMLFAKSP